MVYNPYEDPNLVKRQEQMHNSGLGAFIKPVQQGADAFAGAMENSPVAAPMRRVMADNAAQKTMIATDQNRKERTALGAQFPEGREVFSNNRGMVSNMDPARSAEVVTEARGLRNPVAQAAGMTPPAPAKAPVVAGGMMPTSGEGANNPTPVLNAAQGQLPGNTGQVQAAQPAAGAGLGINLSERDKAIRSSLGAINASVAAGQVPTPQQAEQIANLKQQAGFLRGGTDRVPVGPDGRPIRPGGVQRAGNLDVQFNPSVSPEARGAFMTNPARPTAQIDRFAANKAAEDANFERIRLDARAKNPALAQADQLKTQAALEREKLGLQRDEFGDRKRMTDAQVAGAGLDQEGKRFTLDEQKKVQSLQAIATSPTSTPEQKASAIKELELRGTYKPQKDEFEIKTRKLPAAQGQLDGGEEIVIFSKRTGQQVSGAGMGEGIGQIPATPPPKEKLEKGKTYPTSKGPAIWNGSAFVPV